MKSVVSWVNKLEILSYSLAIYSANLLIINFMR